MTTPTTNTNAVATVTPFQTQNGGAGAFQFMNGSGLNAQGQTIPAPPGNATNANSGDTHITPIVSANDAINHYTTAQQFLNNTQQGVSTQAQNKTNQQAQNQANTQATTQPASQGNQPTTGQNGANGQGTQTAGATGAVDNSDLTNALTGATNALNAGNGITPPDQNAYNKTQAGLTTQENDVQSKLNDINTQISDSSNTFQQQVSQLQSGAFPLTPAQQALISQTQGAVQNLISSTQLAGQAYVQGAKVFGIANGLDRYAPLQALGEINNATATANANVAKVELDGVKQMADLQKGFETDDFDMITKSYDALQNSLDAKQKILSDLSTQIQKQVSDAQTQYNDEVKQYKTDLQNQITNALNSQKLSDTEQQNLVDNALKSDQFTESQKMDLEKTANDAAMRQIQQGQLGVSQENAATERQKLIDSETVPAGTLEDNLSSTYSSGSEPSQKYLDVTDLKTQGYTAQQINAMVQQANQTGTPVVALPADALKLKSIDTAKQNNDAMANQIAPFLAPDSATGKINPTALKLTVSQFLQNNDIVGAFDSWQASVLPDVQALGVAGRMNRNEIDMLQTHDVGKLNMPIGTFLQTLHNLNTMFNDGKNSILIKNRGSIDNTTNAPQQTITYHGKNYAVDAQGNFDENKPLP